MSDHYIGLDLFDLENNGLRQPISRITLYRGDNAALTAGDDTGLEVVADCIYVTKEMVDALLSAARGYQYHAYSAQAARLNPAAELGDTVEVGNIVSVLAQISDHGDLYPDIAAPGDREVEDEYPAAGPLTKAFDKKLAEARSEITKTTDQITLAIYGENGKGGLNGRMNTFTMGLSGISGQIRGYQETLDGYSKQLADYKLDLDGFSADLEKYSEDVTGYKKETASYKLAVDQFETRVGTYQEQAEKTQEAYSTIDQKFNSIKIEATNDSGTVSIQLKSGDTALGTPGTIDLTGLVTFTSLETGPDEEAGQTVINGGWIGTSTLQGKTIKGATYYDDEEIGRLRLAVDGVNGTNYPWLVFDAENKNKEVKELFSVVPIRVDYGWVAMTMLDTTVLTVNDGVVHPTAAWNMSRVNMVASSKNYGTGDPPDDAVEGQVYFKLLS